MTVDKTDLTIQNPPQRAFEKVWSVMLSTQGSPLAPLAKGGNGLEVPLFKGDLGGSLTLIHRRGLLKHPLNRIQTKIKKLVILVAEVSR